MDSKGILTNLGSAATQAGATVGGAVLAGFARKKISFLDTTMGKIALIVIGLFIVAYSKSNTLKGVGIGVATNGALGFANVLGLAGIDGLGTTEGMGQIVQDENGMIYMVNGDDEFLPYEVPVVSGLNQGTSGLFGGDDNARI
jgi:hypothetical protein